MKNTFGNALTLTIFGESHGPAIGVVLDGLAPGMEIDRNYIAHKLSLRRPAGKNATARQEKDEYVIESGVYNGYTTGTSLCILIPNADTHSSDYSALAGKARPGHSDYPANCKYHGFEDARGGGHFSGRITAGVVAAGAILQCALEKKGIVIGTHLKRIQQIADRDFDANDIAQDIKKLDQLVFPVLDEKTAEDMNALILQKREEMDSVGGLLETVILGMPAGVGEPWFDSIESELAHAMFAIPAVKGVEFGDGFGVVDSVGSVNNDPYRYQDGKAVTVTNHAGGIGGGITNGMPITMRCALKPTPSIARKQDTIDFANRKETEIEIKGRHDPCVAHRARAVVDALCAFVMADLLTVRYGTDYLGSAE